MAATTLATTDVVFYFGCEDSPTEFLKQQQKKKKKIESEQERAKTKGGGRKGGHGGNFDHKARAPLYF